MTGTETLGRYDDLRDKVLLVTGGSRGLGAATCRAFAAQGAKVAVNGRDRAAIDAVVADLRDSGAVALAAPADCTDGDAVARLADEVHAALGPVDVVAAFAGGGRAPQPVLEIPVDEWRADIERNLTSTFLTVRAFLPQMLDRGGSIITMASAAARLPGAGPMAYSAAKAGVINFTQQLAREVAPRSVRVNCIAPSTVLNERMRAAIPPDRQRELAAMHPIGRLGETRDVADAALFLASDASSWITGVVLDVAGGQVLR